MDQQRFKYIVSSLECQELTQREKQFVEAVKKCFIETGRLTDQQESILEGIYREKMWIRRVFFGQNNLPKKVPSQEFPK
jgi:uncharacterized membrane-anchored protein